MEKITKKKKAGAKYVFSLIFSLLNLYIAGIKFCSYFQINSARNKIVSFFLCQKKDITKI